MRETLPGIHLSAPRIVLNGDEKEGWEEVQ